MGDNNFRVDKLNKNLELLRTQHPEIYKQFTELTNDPLFGILTGRKIPNQRSIAILANNVRDGRGIVLLTGIAQDLEQLRLGSGGLSQIAIEVVRLPKSPMEGVQTLTEEGIKFVAK